MRAFFENLGENIARGIEEQFGAISNFGKALGDQFRNTGEGLKPK